MKRLPLYLLLLTFCAILSSCDKSGFRGFKKMDNGTYMRFHRENKNNESPMLSLNET